MSTAAIRESHRLSLQRAAKKAGSSHLGDQSRKRSSHAAERLSQRCGIISISFTPRFIKNLLERKRATVEDAGGGLSKIIFTIDGTAYEIIAQLRGKKVKKFITVYLGGN